jgi:hypothetical protein
MKILSIRKGFLADHSSTSYEFMAVDKKLDTKARSAVSRLSSRVRPTTRRASFVYHGDWSDLPGGYDALMAKYYDVMYSESYDWWTLAFAFNTTKKDLVNKLKKYAVRGVEDLGVDVSYRNKRVMITVYCRMDNSYLPESNDVWLDEGYDDDEEETYHPEDKLMTLLVKVRDRLKKGDCQPLYAVWETYGYEDEDGDEPEEAPPKPRRTKAGADIADEFASIIAPIE